MAPECLEVLRGPFLSCFYTIPNITVKQELNPWNGLCHFLSLLGKTDLELLWEVFSEDPEVLNIGLGHPMILDTVISLQALCQKFLSLCQVLGHQWPTGLETLRVLGDSQKRLGRYYQTLLTWPQLWTWRVYFSSTGPKCQNSAKVAKCFQGNIEAQLGTPNYTN